MDRADRSAATIRKALRIARRMFTRRANVNDFCSDAILARDSRTLDRNATHNWGDVGITLRTDLRSEASF